MIDVIGYVRDEKQYRSHNGCGHARAMSFDLIAPDKEEASDYEKRARRVQHRVERGQETKRHIEGITTLRR